MEFFIEGDIIFFILKQKKNKKIQPTNTDTHTHTGFKTRRNRDVNNFFTNKFGAKIKRKRIK